MKLKIKIICPLLILAVLAGCSGQGRSDQDGGQGGSTSREAVLATLYNHYAAEYMALAIQAFNIASDRLTALARENVDCSGMAVVVDIDETIIDNSPHQAMTIRTGESYPAYWEEWCNLASAGAIPGAVEFLKLADSLGFAIFYISNRKAGTVLKATIENLEGLGFPQVNEERLMLREESSPTNVNPSNKESRRQKVESLGYRIILLAGDNLGDFFDDEGDNNTRRETVDSMSIMFGKRFIVLPNAMYGNWPASIGIDGSEAGYDRLIKEMTEPYWSEGKSNLN